jgi:hypothetical protein
MRRNSLRLVIYLCLAFISLWSGCKGKKSEPQEVVIYTSLDKVFSQPILEAFEKETGINVLDVYDSEATKTTGLVNRLIAEKDSPRADIFWNSETGLYYYRARYYLPEIGRFLQTNTISYTNNLNSFADFWGEHYLKFPYRRYR